MKKRPVRAALALTALAAIVPLSGCAALLSAQQTAQYEYNGGDGAWATIDGVEVRGMVLVQNDEGDAQIFYTLVNATDETKQVSITAGPATLTHTLAGDEVFEQNPANSVNTEVEPAIIEGLDAVVGEQNEVEVSVGSESETVLVQVLNDALPYYEGLEPTTSPTDDPTDLPTDETDTDAEDAGAEGAGAQG